MASNLPGRRGERRRLGQGSPFGDLRREMDRLFEGYFPTLTEMAGEAGPMWPAVDVHENDRGYRIEAELPGVSEDHVDVTVSEGVLTIRGEKRSEKEEKDEKGTVVRSERSYGAFERSFPLPADADEENISAESKSGVLTIRIPKTKEPKGGAKRIDIKGK